MSLAGAQTIGDVARLIQDNPPAGRTITATVTAQGLDLDMNDGGGGSLIVTDLQGGITAAELGIVRLSGSATVPIVGSDLDPIVRRTTRLDEMAGTQDLTSGLQVTNGDETHVIDFQGAETVEDLLNILNVSDAMLLARSTAIRQGSTSGRG